MCSPEKREKLDRYQSAAPNKELPSPSVMNGGSSRRGSKLEGRVDRRRLDGPGELVDTVGRELTMVGSIPTARRITNWVTNQSGTGLALKAMGAERLGDRDLSCPPHIGCRTVGNRNRKRSKVSVGRRCNGCIQVSKTLWTRIVTVTARQTQKIVHLPASLCC